MIFLNKVSPNLQLKLLSLLLAALLWLFVTLETSEEADIPLVVTYVNIPSGSTVRESEPQQLSIHAVGPRILLLRLRLKGASAKLDISAAKDGKNTIAGYENSVDPVSGVKFTRVSPLIVVIHPDPAVQPASQQ